MSENTAKASGNSVSAALDDAQLKAFAEWQEKERIRKEKLEQAKLARQAANKRPVNADGTEMNASQAFLHAVAGLLDNYVSAYADDSETLTRRLREQVIPAITAVANSPSTAMAGSQDRFRQLLDQYRAPVS